MVKLTKALGGYEYKIRNTTYYISKFDDAGKEWIIRNEKSAYDYSDPMPTLRDCRLALQDMEAQPDLYEIR